MNLQQRLEQAVVYAVSDLLDTMIPLCFERAPVWIAPTEGEHLLGRIDVSGEIQGEIAVGMSLPVARDLASVLLSEYVEDAAEIYATVAEMTNMIAGNIKTFLCHQSERFEIGLPHVEAAAPVLGDQRLAIPIHTEKGSFVVLSSLFEAMP